MHGLLIINQVKLGDILQLIYLQSYRCWQSPIVLQKLIIGSTKAWINGKPLAYEDDQLRMNCSVAIGSYRGNGNNDRIISFAGYNVQAILVENDFLGTRYAGTASNPAGYGALVLKNYPIRNPSNEVALRIDDDGSLIISNSNFNKNSLDYHYLIFYIP